MPFDAPRLFPQNGIFGFSTSNSSSYSTGYFKVGLRNFGYLYVCIYILNWSSPSRTSYIYVYSPKSISSPTCLFLTLYICKYSLPFLLILRWIYSKLFRSIGNCMHKFLSFFTSSQRVVSILNGSGKIQGCQVCIIAVQT